MVHVEDTGKGIESNEFTKLFTRFGKLKRTAAMNSEGIGLGLTIVSIIVEKSGGAVGVESQGKGHGSTFCFSMPMEQVFDEVKQLEELDDDPLKQLLQSSEPVEQTSKSLTLLKDFQLGDSNRSRLLVDDLENHI